MARCYWEIGRLIVEEEQRGENRAEYRKRLIQDLSKKLQKEFGRGFDKSNLWNMKAFYRTYPKVDALRRELSWTHYRLLLRVEKPEARAFYEAECVKARWSTRELERQINSMLFKRLALSRDKGGVLVLSTKGHEIQNPADLSKDPYVLEFAGIRQDEHFREKDLEGALIDKKDIGQMQMYVNYYHRELTADDENPPIGIILCSDKSEAVVRYTLPEDNSQIFTSRYKLYLPSEQELKAEIIRERQNIENYIRQAGGNKET